MGKLHVLLCYLLELALLSDKEVVADVARWPACFDPIHNILICHAAALCLQLM